jgi:hypothetical protein
MLHIKFDNVQIHKIYLDNTSNYNTSIRIYIDGEFVKGWIDKHTIKDIELIKTAISYLEEKDTRSELDLLLTDS